MCYQLVEYYVVCGCIFYIHAVDECPCADQRGHPVTKRGFGIGHACPKHSICGAFQQHLVIKQQQDDPAGEFKRSGKGDAKPPNNPSITWYDTEDQDLQKAAAAYATKETSINRTLEGFVAPSTGKHAGYGDVEDDSSAPSCNNSIFDAASTSSNSSVERPPDFAEELLSAFVNNVTIVPLFRLALKCNPNQFEKAFTALLRLYAKDLGQMSSSLVEESASRVIKTRSRYIASHLKDYFVACHPGDGLARPIIRQVGPRAQDAAASDDGDNAMHDTFGIPHLFQPRLNQVKRFLFNDVPFLKLRQRLESLAGDFPKPERIVSRAPIPASATYHETPETVDHLEAGQRSILRNGEIEIINPSGKSSVEQKTKEGSFSASKVSIKTGTDPDDNIADAREKPSGTFFQIVILLSLMKRLQRWKIEDRNERQGTALNTSELLSTQASHVTRFPPGHEPSGNCQQSELSQAAGNRLECETRNHSYDESSPLLGRDRRVQELSWICSCGKIVLEHLEQLRPGGITQFLDDVDVSFGRSLRDHGEYACPSGSSRRNKVFIVLGRTMNKWNHSGHNLITGTSCSNVTPGDNLSSNQSTHPTQTPTRSNTESNSVTLQQHIHCACMSCSVSQGSTTDGSSGSSTMVTSHAWIHMCIPSYAGRIRLTAVDLRGFATDGPMFTRINNVYFGTGFWRIVHRTFSLRALTGVDLVHFNVDRHNNVAIDMGDHQKLPPPTEYLYQPCPPAIAGLIPPQFLYTCITNPALTYGHFQIWRDRMPKYTGEELQCRPDEPFTPGYGLYFKETLSWIKIWVIMAFFTISSFTFSGLWIRFHEGSIQDAFTMGGSILTVATIGLGLVHGLDAFWSDRN